MATSEVAAPWDAPPWWEALVDDAGLFPPESLPLPAALARHRRDLTAHSPVLSHRFVCPTAQIDALPAGPLDVIALGPVPEVEALAPAAGVRVVSVETRLEAQGSLEAGSPDVPVFVEVPLTEALSTHLDLVAASGHWVKVRCGGTTAAAFPSPDDLADLVVGCVRRDLPFKATAGLHHAVAHHDPVTGFDHFGFLNLLAATAAASAGAGTGQVSTLLSDRSLDLTDTSEWATARRWFRSIGSCSTSDPITDLATLGLVPAPTSEEPR